MKLSKRWKSILAVAALSNWAWYSPVLAESEKSSSGQPQQVILPNGLKVLMVEDSAFPVVSCFMFYRVGSRNEYPGISGLAHLLEHLLFQNVGTYKKGELGRTIVRNGGQFNGFTSDDFTVYFETLPSSKLDLALSIESQRMRKATFTAAEVKDEIAKVQRDIEAQEENPDNDLARQVKTTAFAHHPYKNPTIGWSSDVANLTLQDVKAMYDRFYHPNNATLVLVGDFKASAANALLTKYFETATKGAASLPAVRAVEPPQTAERRVILQSSQSKKDVVEIAYHAPSFTDADALPMVVLEKLLNMPVTGRLKKGVIDPKAAGTARCAFELKRDPSLVSITLSGGPGTHQRAVDAWDGVVAQLKGQPITDAELKRAKRQAVFSFYADRDGPYHHGFDVGFCDMLHSWQTGAAFPEKIAAVTTSDVQRAARKYLNYNSRTIGILAAPAPPAVPTPPKTTYIPDDNPILTEVALDTARQIHNNELVALKTDDSLVAAETSGATLAKPATNTSTTTNSTSSTSATTTTTNTNATATAPSMPAAAPLRAAVKKFVLKNGLTVVALESKLSPVVQIQGLVRAGRVFESENKPGTSDLLASCLNGSSTKLSHAQIQSMQEEYGLPAQAMLKYEVSEQALTFHARCLKSDLSNELNLISSTLRDPSLEDAEVERARREVLNNFVREDESLSEQVNRALMRSLIAPKSSYFPPDLPERAKSVSALKGSDVKEFHDAHVLPELTTLVICGDVVPEQAARIAEQTFASWTAKGANRAFPSVQPNPRHVMKSSIPLKDRDKSYVCLGKLVTLGADANAYANLLIADCALTNHPIFSRVALRLSNEPSLSENVSLEEIESRFIPVSNAVVWTLNLPVEPELIPQTVKSVQTELQTYLKAGITQEEFNEARRYVLGALAVKQFASDSDAAKSISDSVQQGLSASSIDDLMPRVRASTLESLNQFIKTSFRPDMASLVVAGSKQTLRSVHGTQSVEPEAEKVDNSTESKDSK